MRLTRLLLTLITAATCAGATALAEADTVPPTTYTLNVTFAGTGSGVIRGGDLDCHDLMGKPIGPCTITAVAGNTVTLNPAADRNSGFAGWSGDKCSGSGACTLTLDENVTVTATFNQSTVSIKRGPLTVGANRTVSLPMTCGGPGTCYGTLQVTAKPQGKAITVASATYNLADATTKNVILHVSAATMTALKKNHNALSATLTLTPNESTKHPTTTLRLKLA